MGDFRQTWAAVLMFGSLASTVSAADTLLYAPTSTEQTADPASPADGVLVRRITIKPGDTLSKLSRSYNGKGSYYPQILLFNDIADPNRIYAGRTLLVPVAARHGEAAASPATIPVPAAARTTKPAAPVPAATSQPAAPSAEQTLYNRSLAAYQQKQFRQAMNGFSRFLARYPASPLAPDAALYKADAMLKLAGD